MPPALQDVLRHANVSSNHQNFVALLDSLKRIQLERSEKLQEHYDSSLSIAQGTLAERLSKADGDLRTILGPLYSHTAFQQVHLANPQVEDDLKRLEAQLDEANEQLVSAEVNELSLSDAKVRGFIEKYGK